MYVCMYDGGGPYGVSEFAHENSRFCCKTCFAWRKERHGLPATFEATTWPQLEPFEGNVERMVVACFWHTLELPRPSGHIFV